MERIRTCIGTFRKALKISESRLSFRELAVRYRWTWL